MRLLEWLLNKFGYVHRDQIEVALNKIDYLQGIIDGQFKQITQMKLEQEARRIVDTKPAAIRGYGIKLDKDFH
jgi:hypothetical protein